MVKTFLESLTTNGIGRREGKRWRCSPRDFLAGEKVELKSVLGGKTWRNEGRDSTKTPLKGRGNSRKKLKSKWVKTGCRTRLEKKSSSPA